MFLIKKGKEQQYVSSLDGYDGWTVLAEGATAKPKDCCDFDGEKWVPNKEKKDKENQRAKRLENVPDRNTTELAAFLMERLEELQKQIDELKNK